MTDCTCPSDPARLLADALAGHEAAACPVHRADQEPSSTTALNDDAGLFAAFRQALGTTDRNRKE